MKKAPIATPWQKAVMQSEAEQQQYRQRKFLVVSIVVGVVCAVALTWAAGKFHQRADQALKTAVNRPIPQATPVQWAGAGAAPGRAAVHLGTVVVTIRANGGAEQGNAIARAARAAVAAGSAAAAQ